MPVAEISAAVSGPMNTENHLRTAKFIGWMLFHFQIPVNSDRDDMEPAEVPCSGHCPDTSSVAYQRGPVGRLNSA